MVGGLKPTYLRSHRHEIIEPELDHEDFKAALRTAQASLDQHHPEVVVGSSRGGSVAINIESGSARLVLICPTWKKWGSATMVWAVCHGHDPHELLIIAGRFFRSS